MVSKLVLFVMVCSPLAAFAQTTPVEPPSPPPMVPAAPPPPPGAEPGSQLVEPGTPPPPSSLPPPGYVPGQPGSGYQYSPYGTPQQPLDQKPPLEWGLMLSESLFGMLTSAGISLIPYFLLLRPMVQGYGRLSDDPPVNTAIFCLIFAALPLVVAQTQISLANGSRYYSSEMWPVALAGLAAEAGVLAIFMLDAVKSRTSGMVVGQMTGGPEAWLLVGSIGLVPLIQMAVINLTKSPKAGRVAAVSRDEKGKLALGLPTVAPLVAQTRLGLAVGMQAQLINFKF